MPPPWSRSRQRGLDFKKSEEWSWQPARKPDKTCLEVSGRTVDAFIRKYVKEKHGIDLA